MKPFFSIIIPLYNKEAHVKNTIRSVINQSYNNFEILVINDGSTDASLEIVNAINDSRIKVFSKINEGVSSARNFGIKKATGEFVAFLDADDVWEVSFLEHINYLITQFPQESVFSTAIKISTSKKTYNANYLHLPNDKQVMLIDFFRSSMDHPILSGSSCVLKKESLDKIGWFNTTLKTGEDTDFWIRIGLIFKVVFSIKILVTVVISDKSLTKQNRKEYLALDFSKYEKHSNSISSLNPYLNKNMFSSALKYRLVGDIENYKKLKNKIDFNKLNIKQKALLNLPLFITKIAVNIYNKITPKKNYF